MTLSPFSVHDDVSPVELLSDTVHQNGGKQLNDLATGESQL